MYNCAIFLCFHALGGCPVLMNLFLNTFRSLSMSKFTALLNLFVPLVVMLVALPMSQAHAQLGGFNDPTNATNNTSRDLVPQRENIDAGTLEPGGTKEIVTLFKNESGSDITITRVELIPTSNVSAEINLNQCQDGALESGVECAISVSVIANQSGRFEVNVLVNHDGRSRLTTANITGVIESGLSDLPVLGTAEIISDPETVDFGTSTGRTSLIRAITLKNTTSTLINIEDVRLVASNVSGFKIDDDECERLNAGQSCILTASWAPQVAGASEGVLVIDHSGATSVLNIPLKGVYSPEDAETAPLFPTPVPGKGLIITDLSSIDFGTSVDGAASITASVINEGDAPVTIRTLRLAGSDNGLTIAAGGCGQGTILLPTQACILSLNWSPKRIGPVIDDVIIRHTGARGALILPVRGGAVAVAETDKPLVSSISTGSSEANFFNSGGDTSGSPRFSGIPPLPASTGIGQEIGVSIETSPARDTSSQAPSLDTSTEQAVTAATTNNNMPRQKSIYNLGYPPGYLASGATTSLDGFKVSSHSQTSAVLAGPRGRLVVNDGEVSLIGGARWIPRIVPEGVELIGETDVVLILFDRSFSSTARGAAGTTIIDSINETE